jgi:hypothetical protein
MNNLNQVFDVTINYIKFDSILIDDRLTSKDAICGIYLWVNTFNQKVYVGQSIHIKRRIVDELRHTDQVSNKHLQNAIAKYKEYFRVNLIRRCNKNDLDFYEQVYIRLFCSWDRAYGYNKSLGGGKTLFVEEIRNRISNSHTGMVLKPFTEKHKERLKISNREYGKQKTAKRIINLNTNEIYTSIRDCARKTGLGYGFKAAIKFVCNGEYKQIKGFKFGWYYEN